MRSPLPSQCAKERRSPPDNMKNDWYPGGVGVSALANTFGRVEVFVGVHSVVSDVFCVIVILHCKLFSLVCVF